MVDRRVLRQVLGDGRDGPVVASVGAANTSVVERAELQRLMGSLGLCPVECDLPGARALFRRRGSVAAIVGMAADRLAAARLAYDHAVVYVDLGAGDAIDVAALSTTPVATRPVGLVGTEAAPLFAIERACIRTPGSLDVAISDTHRWERIGGPITVEISRRRPDTAWITIADGPAVLLDVDPPTALVATVTLHDPGVVIVDEVERRDIKADRSVSVSVPRCRPVLSR